MNTPCAFDASRVFFAGSPAEQARCLLRHIRRGGDVDDPPPAVKLPKVLDDLLAAPEHLGLTVARLRSFLKGAQIPEETVGGSLDEPVCLWGLHGDRPAHYFLIHDTSSKLAPGQDFDPKFINTMKWKGNHLENLPSGITHVFITRVGETKTDNNYRTAWFATQFQHHPPKPLTPATAHGMFLHHELVQPRMGKGSSDIEAPEPGFTPVQYERLALQYIIASVRRGSWMIPGFHCVLDLGVGTHDDPQHFDLPAWGAALEKMLAAVRGS
jgi:hypothetical protein